MTTTARGFMGAGGVQFSLIVAGVAQGYGLVRETSQFEIKPNSETKELVSKGRETYGQVIETVAIAKPSEVTIKLREGDYQNLMIAFMGTPGVGVNQGAATVTAETAVVKFETFTELANRNIAAAGFVVTNTDASSSYVLGVDYEVIYLTGQLRALVGGSITDGQSVKVGYAAQAMAGKKIMGATQTSIRAKILFTGKNIANDAPVLLTAWEGVFTPDSAFDLLADDFGEITLKGQLKTPVGKTSPFELDFL